MLKKLFLIIPVFFIFLFSPSLVEAYTVQPGDTLSEIAYDHDVSLQKIQELNPDIENPHLIYVGQDINIDSNRTKNKSGNSGDKENRVTKANIGYPPTDREKDLFARVVHAEAKGEPFEGKVAVAQVILNRVEDSSFPNTISEVIHQPGQFQPVANGAIQQPASQESIKAIEEALSNREKYNTGALFFYNPDISTSSWIFTTKTVAEIGNHVFSH